MKKLFNLMNKIIINTKEFLVNGNNIVVENINNSTVSISVDGKHIQTVTSNEVVIKFEGDLANLSSTSAVVNGNVMSNVKTTNLKVGGSITGNVNSTNVKVENDIIGDVSGVNIKASRIKN
jgi:hypothetical protein